MVKAESDTETYLYALGTVFGSFVALLFISFIYRRLNPPQKKVRNLKEEEATTTGAGGVRRPVRRKPARRQQDESDDDDEPAPAGLEDVDENDESTKKIGRKKQAKLDAKAERLEANREAAVERERKQKELEEKRAERLKLEKEQEEEEKRLEEEAKRKREDQEKREMEEYLALKSEFQVEEEGIETLTDEEERTLLNSFINYIKERKVVMLDDVAAAFKLKTQDVIDRLNQLTQDGVLTGVMDDRGKYIYITENELKAVAEFVEERGRVSISDLVQWSNKLIRLEEGASG